MIIATTEQSVPGVTQEGFYTVDGTIFAHWTEQDEIGLFLDNRATGRQFPLEYT